MVTPQFVNSSFIASACRLIQHFRSCGKNVKICIAGKTMRHIYISIYISYNTNLKDNDKLVHRYQAKIRTQCFVTITVKKQQHL